MEITLLSRVANSHDIITSHSTLLEVLTPQGRCLGESLSFLSFFFFSFLFPFPFSLFPPFLTTFSYFVFEVVFLAPKFIKKIFKTQAKSSNKIKRQTEMCNKNNKNQ